MKFTYMNKKTSIHMLHPVCKLLWALGMITGTIFISDPVLLLILFLSTFPFVFFAKIFHEWKTFIKFALWLSFFIVTINILINHQGLHVVFSVENIPFFGVLSISLESLVFGLSMSLRLLTMISVFAVISLTINPDDLLQLILKLKIPYHTVLATAIAIRFIPCLFNDISILQDSLRARGYILDRGNLISRLKKRSILILPLLSNSLERSIQSAESMESRGFGLRVKKTYYKTIKTTTVDVIFIFLSASLLFMFIFMKFQNIGKYNFYPVLSQISLSFSYLLTVVSIVVISISPAVFSHIKKVIDFD